MPMAAKVAQPVNCLINGLVDSFMMMLLLSLSFHSRIGMAHHSSFGKVLSCGSLPLIGAKFRYVTSLEPGYEGQEEDILVEQVINPTPAPTGMEAMLVDS